MSKRSKLSSGFHSMECFEDRISELPDELLVKILSELTLKEAGQTSTISRRWKTLWTFIDWDFDFADPVTLCRLKEDSSLPSLQNKRDKYVKWVNQVLTSHQGLVISGLKICFDLDKKYKADLDAWIEFAVQKQTSNLLVDLSTDNISPNLSPYPFPVQILSSKSNIKILRSLNLHSVNVSGPILQDILLNCTCLEALHIFGSQSLVDAKICGELKLKLIEIRSCMQLRTVQVSAGELECLIYYGEAITSQLRICHAPKLHSLYLGDRYLTANRIPSPLEVPSMYSQIETFVLDFRKSSCLIDHFPISGLPEFKNLKCLEVKVATPEHQSILSLISVVKAFPMLQKFVVEFQWYLQRTVFTSKQRKTSKIQVLEEKLERLKEVEFKWFSGLTPDSELVMSLLENAPNVESLVFDARYPTDITFPVFSDEDRTAARECARHLATSHSPKARLLIL